MHLNLLGLPVAVFAILAVKGLAILALTYFGARLAIRHERRTSN
jgi:hypothetical protein